MQRSSVTIPTIFTALAVIFVALVLHDFLRADGKLDPRRATWLRVALIFAAVAIALHISQLWWP